MTQKAKFSMDAANVNSTFPKYPITVNDKGWVCGVWYCGTSFKKVELYGQHPQTYLKRLVSLFPGSKEWLICPSGIIDHGVVLGKNFTTVDLVSRKEGHPQILSNASELPFEDNSFDVVGSDPPYGIEHCKVYEVPKYPRKKAMAEFHRVLKPGGYLCWLDIRYPIYKKRDWNLVGLICIVTGFERVTRVCSIFQKINNGQPIHNHKGRKVTQLNLFDEGG